MENKIEKKKSKKTALILILAIGIPVIIISALLVFYFITRPKPVKSIKITSKITEMESGQNKYEINYEILPKKAANKKVTVSGKNGIVKSTKITSNKIIVETGTARGQEKICVTSEENKKIKDCIDVLVKPEPFSERMKRYGYVNKGNGIYFWSDGQFNTEINVYDQTISMYTANKSDAYLNYKYYYRRGYGEAHNSSGGFNVDWYYQDSTRRASCTASSYYTTFCNYTSESSTINNFDNLKNIIELIIGDYTDIETQS